jgi:hypothetical protein
MYRLFVDDRKTEREIADIRVDEGMIVPLHTLQGIVPA